MSDQFEQGVEVLRQQIDAKIASYFSSCVHCGLCAEACLFYTETHDPRYTPIYKLEPMKKIVCSLREHEELLMNWFRAKGEISAGVVEGFNNKAKLTTRKAYGFRTANGIETALYHQLGALPEPNFTHKFC